ncbi:MAG TPA: S8/S53 family peptidase [Trebonia sp.]|nr:S8/S53 family peptidase [Trebonia sp.]
MDDSVFSSQFLAMHDAFARNQIDIEVAYTPSGRVDYIYEAGRLLARSDKKRIGGIAKVLPGVHPVTVPGFPKDSPLTLLSIDDLEEGYLTVPQALDVLDARLDIHGPEPDGFPLVTPVHILHITQSSPDTTRTCPATEPEVPCCCGPDQPCAPCPPAAPAGGAGVSIGICDSGLLPNLPSALSWLNQVTCGPTDWDPLGPVLPSGLFDIPRYCGHGTFVAGVAASQAPEASVYVTKDFVMAGGEREWVIVQQLEALIARRPQLVNLSAGTYSRKDWPLLSFLAFELGDIVLTAAAGNDATHRRFYPAAFPWAIAVGALGADLRNRAWFSNYGDWVDVFTLGEGLVNAYATGQYTYLEPPKRPATQVFDGIARWSGTSFAAPMVAGLIAARMSSSVDVGQATLGLLDEARQNAIDGVGPVVLPWQPPGAA